MVGNQKKNVFFSIFETGRERRFYKKYYLGILKGLRKKSIKNKFMEDQFIDLNKNATNTFDQQPSLPDFLN